nr:TetR family transcriptional regulator [Desulfobulbaceae bacterium]
MTVKKRLGKNQWLAKAIEVLAESGVDEIKVDGLARMLSMSRNGFYYHFRDRSHFLEELLDYWEHEYTRIISGDKTIQLLSPEERFEKVIKMVQQYQLSKYDLAIISWAKKDPRAKKAVQRVFAMRLAFVGKIFEELGFTNEELELRTKLFVAYHANAGDIFDDYYTAESKEFHMRQLKFLLKR